ncbi:hypothetical protein GCM10011356_07370 [Kangiella profundi]|nr:hypothetical protein GCM10011356_07370 [Kangiella profundi]
MVMVAAGIGGWLWPGLDWSLHDRKKPARNFYLPALVIIGRLQDAIYGYDGTVKKRMA